MLDHGAPLNARDAGGQSALIRAVGGQNALVVAVSLTRGKIVSFLLAQNGIDVTVRDVEGLDALGRAKKNGYSEIGSRIEAFIAMSGFVGTAQGY